LQSLACARGCRASRQPGLISHDIPDSRSQGCAGVRELQALLDLVADEYNQRRPHRRLPQRTTPATTYAARPKGTPTVDNRTDSHDRVRHDKIDTGGKLTLRANGRLHHIGMVRTLARTPVIMLIHNLEVRIWHAATGKLLRELTIDPTRGDQPSGKPRYPP
jgi:hypothetical protein